MCNYCESGGWNEKCCNFCGVNSTVHISISIALPNGEDYPYTTTDLCEKCWHKYGINEAFEHNERLRECSA